jgi:nucleoside 2-deoxyribosyltransferase
LEEITSQLESRGVNVYLPHRDGGDLGTVILGRDGDAVRGNIFEKDIEHLRQSDLIVCLLDGQDSDSGTCVEMGIAFMSNARIYGLKSDLDRRGGVVNNMVWGVCDRGKTLFADVEGMLGAIDALLKSKNVRKGRE